MAAEAARISSEAETARVTATSPPTNAVTANRITNDSKILDKLGGLGAVIPASMLPSQNLPVDKPPIVAKKYFAEFSDNDLCGSKVYLFVFHHFLKINFGAMVRFVNASSVCQLFYLFDNQSVENHLNVGPQSVSPGAYMPLSEPMPPNEPF